MVNAVKNNINIIVQACKEMPVQSLYLLGSGARATGYHKESDLDLLFQFKKDKNGLPQTAYDYFDGGKKIINNWRSIISNQKRGQYAYGKNFRL